MSGTLPAGFETLEPFAVIWAADTAQARADLRSEQTADARQAFYDAMTLQLHAALDRLDQTPLAAHDDAEARLMRLALSYAHIGMAIEVQGPDEAKHATSRWRLPITRAPADA